MQGLNLKLSANKPIILVDGSYFVFHRFFATLKWYKFKNPDIDGSSCMDTDEFRDAILKHTLSDITKLRKKWAIPKEGKKRISKEDWETIPLWLATDCHRSEIWRSSIVDGYKGTRDMAYSRDTFDKRCFQSLYECISNELNIPLLEMDKLEADDIVALTHRKLRQMGYDGKIVCITNDNDYLQLRDENTDIYNLDNKNLLSRSCGDRQRDLFIKILTGDKSDNILPVRKKLTEKKIREMDHLSEKEILEELALDTEELKRSELNRTLIDFYHIPSEFVDKYNSMFNIELL